MSWYGSAISWKRCLIHHQSSQCSYLVQRRNPRIFVTEAVSNCGESVIEHLTGDPKEQRRLIDVIFSWFGKTARSGQYPQLAHHLDLWKDVKAQRRADIQRIQREAPDHIVERKLR
jgi:hypothetical protein